MGGNAVELRIQFCGGQETVRHSDQCVRLGTLEADVPAEQVIHIVHHTGIHHGQRAPHAFLRRLEDQFDPSVQCIHVFFQQFRYGQADGHMPVVPAGMHGFCMGRTKTFGRRAMSFAFVFFHIVAVHVKAESNGLAGSARIQNANHAGLAAGHLFHQRQVCPFGDGTFHIPFQLCSGGTAHHGRFRNHFGAKMHFIAQRLQFFNDQGSRTEFRPACFRVAVQVTPPGHQFFF